MSDEIMIITPKSIEEMQGLSKILAASQLMPEALRNKPADVFTTLATGAELGLAPMQAIRAINVIKGRASLSADLMAALVKRSPLCEYLQLVELTDKICTYRTKRKGDPEPVEMSFTAEDAKQAGLLGNDNWRKYPKAMLRARNCAQICRAVYPDLCLGLYDSISAEIEEVQINAAPVATGEQAEHVQSVRDQLRAQVRQNVVEGEVVKVESAADQLRVRIKAAGTVEALQALIPDLAKLTPEEKARIRPEYEARKAEVQ